MQKLESLTEDQIEKMEDIKKHWLDYIFSCKNSINRESATINIDWLYKKSNLKKPIIIYMESPMGCQMSMPFLKVIFKVDSLAQVWAQVGDQVRAQVGDQVRAQVGDQVWAQVMAQVRAQVGDQVGDQVWAQVMAQVGAQVGDQVRDQVGDQVWAQVGAQVGEYENFSSNGNIWDYGWVSFYDFFQSLGLIKYAPFDQYKELLKSGIYDMIQLNGFCIVSNLPDRIKRDAQGRLHNSEGSAIHFRDGYELFFWHGTAVAKKWIKNPEIITAKEIISESNAEKRRVLREILGGKKYYELAYGIGGLVLIDEDNDNQGNPMKLYETKKADEIINKKVQFIEVVCPSTMRVYNIYPPNQKSKNVFEAKASTFGKKQNQFNPLIET